MRSKALLLCAARFLRSLRPLRRRRLPRPDKAMHCNVFAAQILKPTPTAFEFAIVRIGQQALMGFG